MSKYQISNAATRKLDNIFPGIFYWHTGEGEYYTSTQWILDTLGSTVYGSDGEIVDLSTYSLEDIEALASTEEALASDEFKIYDLDKSFRGSKKKTPKTVYLPQQLTEPVYKVYEFSWGERTSEIYYSTFDGNEYTDEVARVTYTFNRDENNFYVKSRSAVMSWVLGNNTVSLDVKAWTKYYTPIQQIAEIKCRRENLISDIQRRAVAFGVSEAIEALFADFTVEINRWRDSGDRAFVEALANPLVTVYPWIDLPIPADPDNGIPEGSTIRDLLVVTFSIATLPA